MAKKEKMGMNDRTAVKNRKTRIMVMITNVPRLGATVLLSYWAMNGRVISATTKVLHMSKKIGTIYFPAANVTAHTPSIISDESPSALRRPCIIENVKIKQSGNT